MDALRDAAKAMSSTRAPAILLAWRGAHTWVMTGFRADADPLVFKDAVVSGTYILDPWYPFFGSTADLSGRFWMVRNYLSGTGPGYLPEV